jgi:hypothetical protein
MHSGDNTLRTNLNYNVDHIVRIVDEFDTVKGLMNEMNLEYASLPGEVESGSTAALNINIENPNTQYIFKNVTANITTNLPMSFESLSFGEMSIKQFNNLITKDITFPNVEEVTIYDITFDIKYETEYGQKINIIETKKITVNPKSQETVVEKVTEAVTEAIVEEPFEGSFRDRMKKMVEDFGVWQFTAIFVSCVLIFFLITMAFMRKMLKKVKEFEKYEKHKL